MAKVKTFDQVAASKRKAVSFTENVLEDPDRAAEIEAESVEDYADRKKFLIENPNREDTMPETMTKDQLEELLDDVGEKLDQALDPKLTREELVELVEQASDLIEGDEEEEMEENPE